MRRLVALVGLVPLLVFASACSDDGGKTSSSTAPASSSTTSTTAGREPAADQTPPTGTNGIAVDGDLLWIADLFGGQILVADRSTGAVLDRFGAPAGVTGGPDDLVVDGDTVYWTAFDGGQVGRLRGGESTPVAQVGPGANPIAFALEGGGLYVGRALKGNGLFFVDPADGSVRTVLADDGEINAFAFGADGALYGPRTDGVIVRIDVETGAMSEVGSGFGYPAAVKAEGDRLLVLSAVPPGVSELDPETGAVKEVAKPATTVVDNLAIAEDGTIYVSAFNEPLVSVITPDGEVSTITIGQR